MVDGLGGSTAVSASAMKAQSERLRMVSENLANADTPGYRRKIAAFDVDRSRSASSGAIVLSTPTLDQSDLKKSFDPSHPLADQDGYIETSNVNMIAEIADAREAQRSYEANLKVFDQARKMRRDLLELLRR